MLVILQHKIVNFESVRFLEKSEMGYRFVFSKEDFVDTDLDDEDIQSLLLAYQTGLKLFYPHDRRHIDVSDFPSVLEGENTGTV